MYPGREAFRFSFSISPSYHESIVLLMDLLMYLIRKYLHIALGYEFDTKRRLNKTGKLGNNAKKKSLL